VLGTGFSANTWRSWWGVNGNDVKYKRECLCWLLDIINTHVMGRQLGWCFFLLVVALCYDQHDDFKWIMSYYEDNSQYPIIHAYYNKHFSSTPQFSDFLVVL